MPAEDRGITARVQKDMVDAMRMRDKERVTALRMILSELKLAAKEAGSGFDEAGEVAVLIKEKKRRQQAADSFRQAGSEDRAAREEAEEVIIDTYLPPELGEDELQEIIDEAVAVTGATGVKDMGKVMAEVMKRTAGRADGKKASSLVRARLAG